MRIADGNGQAAAAIVVEVQLATDARKQLSWPVYVTALRAQLGCPVMLLVVALSDDVATWARQAIDLGHPGFRLAPLVLASSSVPRVTDSALARRLPELAVLSVMSRPDKTVAQAAIEALALLEEDWDGCILMRSGACCHKRSGERWRNRCRSVNTH
ncbi:MAG: hypothetical protein HY698_01515 [Deltaproteobacteria bacterium]|nr:hypothetical protein [Deltaproteobacteria bacterium]